MHCCFKVENEKGVLLSAFDCTALTNQKDDSSLWLYNSQRIQITRGPNKPAINRETHCSS